MGSPTDMGESTVGTKLNRSLTITLTVTVTVTLVHPHTELGLIRWRMDVRFELYYNELMWQFFPEHFHHYKFRQRLQALDGCYQQCDIVGPNCG